MPDAFMMFWHGQTHEDLERHGDWDSSGLSALFPDMTGAWPELCERLGVGCLSDMMNPEPLKYDEAANPESWVTPERVANAVDRLVARLAGDDQSVQPILREYEQLTRGSRKSLVEELEALKDQALHASSQGARRVTLDMGLEGYWAIDKSGSN